VPTTGYRPGYETVAERIIELIAARGLRAGARLPTESELAVELGVSRGVTREAVKVLAALGRVSAQRGRGLFVGPSERLLAAPGPEAPTFVPGDPAQIEELLRFRQIQDVAAARGAAQRATPPDLRRLRELLDDGARALTVDDPGAFDEADTGFHVAVAAAAQNRFLRAAIANARTLQHQVVLLGLRGSSSGEFSVAHDEHQQIYDAVAAGDPERAEAAAHSHLERTIEGFRTAIARTLNDSPEPPPENR
jgi:GntR family transcriptional repressor for pyruvate dehydrogenase complex